MSGIIGTVGSKSGIVGYHLLDGATINGITIQNDVHTFSASFAQALSITNYWDVTVPSGSNMFVVHACIGYYPGASYFASLFALYGCRNATSEISSLKEYGSNTHANTGSWNVAYPSNTTIRINKVGGSGSATSPGFIQVTFKGT